MLIEILMLEKQLAMEPAYQLCLPTLKDAHTQLLDWGLGFV